MKTRLYHVDFVGRLTQFGVFVSHPVNVIATSKAMAIYEATRNNDFYNIQSVTCTITPKSCRVYKQLFDMALRGANS